MEKIQDGGIMRLYCYDDPNVCKFCGQAKAGSGEWKYCPTCGAYCMRKCRREGVESWHKEPCISCERNPYKARHRWTGERWEGRGNEDQ